MHAFTHMWVHTITYTQAHNIYMHVLTDVHTRVHTHTFMQHAHILTHFPALVTAHCHMLGQEKALVFGFLDPEHTPL